MHTFTKKRGRKTFLSPSFLLLLNSLAMLLPHRIMFLEHRGYRQIIRTTLQTHATVDTLGHRFHCSPGKIDRDCRRHATCHYLIPHCRCNHNALRTRLAILTAPTELLPQFPPISLHHRFIFIRNPVGRFIKRNDFINCFKRIKTR